MSAFVLFQSMAIGAVLVIFIAAIGSIRYRVTSDALEVDVLGRRVRRIPLDDIEEVNREGAFLHESWSGWRFWNAVTLRRRRGLFRHVIITPDEPDRFVEDMNRLLAARSGAWLPPGSGAGSGAMPGPGADPAPRGD